MKVQHLSWLTIKTNETQKCARQALCFLQKLPFFAPINLFLLLFFFSSFFFLLCLLHSLYPAKLIPPAKFPPSFSLTDCPNPGPFSHFSSTVRDVHENPYRPYRHNFLYNEVSIKYRVIQDLCRLLSF